MKYTGPLPIPKSQSFIITPEITVAAGESESTGIGLPIPFAYLGDKTFKINIFASLLNSETTLTSPAHEVTLTPDENGVVTFSTTATYIDSVTNGGGWSSANAGSSEGFIMAPDTRQVEIVGPQTYKKLAYSAANLVLPGAQLVCCQAGGYSTPEAVRAPNVRDTDGTMHGDLGLPYSNWDSETVTPVTYAAAPTGDWAVIGSLYSWKDALLPGSAVDATNTLYWLDCSIPPLKVLYADPMSPPPDSTVSNDKGDTGSDTVTIKYVNGDNRGTPYVTGNDGDGFTATGEYDMSLHLPFDPPYTIPCPIPGEQSWHYHAAQVKMPISTIYADTDVTLNFPADDIEDEGGFTMEDGKHFAEIALGGATVATVELPVVSACCGLAGILVDTLVPDGVTNNGVVGNTWEGAWSNPDISTYNGITFGTAPPVLHVPVSEDGNYTATLLAWSIDDDHWMAVDEWGSDGYDGCQTHNYVKTRANTWVAGMAFSWPVSWGYR
jgi:hypothetical protein